MSHIEASPDPGSPRPPGGTGDPPDPGSARLPGGTGDPPDPGSARLPGGTGDPPDAEAGAGTSGPPPAGAGTLSLGAVRPAPGPDGAAREQGHRLAPADRARRRDRERRLTGAVVLASAVAGAFAGVSPTGDRLADRVLAAGLAALVAAAASSARRWTWFVAAGAGLALARDGVAAAAGLAALAVAFASTSAVRPHPARGALVGGLAAVALMRAGGPSATGASALLVALALAPVLASGYRHARHRTRRRVRLGVLVVGLGAVAAVALYAAALVKARPEAERGLRELDLGVAAARAGDDQTATRHLDAAADAFEQVDDRLAGPLTAPAHWLPVVGHNARATGAMATSAATVARRGADSAVRAEADRLTVSDGRLDLDRVRALQRPFGQVAGTLDASAARLDNAASPWLLPPVADRLDRVEAAVADVSPDVDVAVAATQAVPAMFGADGTSRWLVAFVTPVEARGTGFMGNFAELTATDGRVEMTRFGRATELEQGGTPGVQRTLDGPADYLARWERFAPASTWRNITLSPDFPSVAQVMAQLYPQSGGQQVDGVIAVDPAGLAALLRLTGPITAPGIDRELTADNAAEFLLRDQYVELPDNPERIDALESLSRATFDSLTTGDLPGPGEVADALAPAVADGHIHMWAADADQQDLIDDLGLDGALPDVSRADRDYLRVVSNNATGSKVDLFLSRQVSYDARWDPDTGAVTGTATITLTNDAPTTGLPRYVIGNSLRSPLPAGANRTLLSVYSPWEATEATLDGRPVAMERQIERGMASYSLFLDVPPAGGTRTVTLALAGHMAPGDRYRLDVGTQPLVTPDLFDLSLDASGTDALTFRGERVPPDGAVAASVPLHKEQTTFVVAVDS